MVVFGLTEERFFIGRAVIRQFQTLPRSAMRAAACTSRVVTPHSTPRAFRVPRSRSRRRGSRRSALAASDVVAADPADLLVQWATKDGLVLSPKVVVGSAFPGAPRGLVAIDDIQVGECVIQLPTKCTAFDAAAARADTALGLGDAIVSYESTDSTKRGHDVSDETALALFVALAKRHPERTEFGAYVTALPEELPHSPLFLDDETFNDILPATPLSLIDETDDARVDLFLAWDVAAAVVDRLVISTEVSTDDREENNAVTGLIGTTEVGTENKKAKELTLDEFTWAWASVRSRAITFRVQAVSAEGEDNGENMETNEDNSEGETKKNISERKTVTLARRCLVPVVDMMNHACEACPGDADSEHHHPGPAVREVAVANAVEWRATRDIKKNQEVTWTYGADLSNERLWLYYGFCPDPPVHKGTSVTFSFLEKALLVGIQTVCKDDAVDVYEKRLALLQKAGVGFSVQKRKISDQESLETSEDGCESAEGNDENRALQFTASCASQPTALAGIAGIACCDAGEVSALYETLRRDEDATAQSVGTFGKRTVTLSPESRRRAGRYVAFLLGQIESTAVGEELVDDRVAVDGSSDNTAVDSSDTTTAIANSHNRVTTSDENSVTKRALSRSIAFQFAKSTRQGAVATFQSIAPMLENETLLANDDWIDQAVETALMCR